VRPDGPRILTRWRLAAVAVLPLLLSACAQEPMSEQGKKVYTEYNIVLAIALVIGIGVIAMILLTCVRYRKAPGDDTLPPQTHGNTTFEIIWTAVPTIIVLALFAMSFTTIRQIDKPSSTHAAVIEVRGYQWNWTFDYGNNPAGVHVLIRPTEDEKEPVMVVPVGEKVHIEERSDNVIHSFFVPAFLFKRDVVPGKANGFDLTVSSPGVYKGQCAELCGTDHAKMTFKVKAVGRTEFDKWFNDFKPPPIKCDPNGQAGTSATIHSVPNATEFQDKCAYLAAGQPAKITFVNGGGFPHNVAVYEGAATAGKLLQAGKIIQSGSETFDVPALKAGGDYTFICQVHPLMEGKVIVK
jgi:cytochrome c oxidase subunit 2